MTPWTINPIILFTGAPTTRLLDEIGDDCMVGNIDEALAAARKHLGLPAEDDTVGRASA